MGYLVVKRSVLMIKGCREFVLISEEDFLFVKLFSWDSIQSSRTVMVIVGVLGTMLYP